MGVYQRTGSTVLLLLQTFETRNKILSDIAQLDENNLFTISRKV